MTALRQELRLGSQSVAELFGSLVDLALEASCEALVDSNKCSESCQTGNNLSRSCRSRSRVVDHHGRQKDDLTKLVTSKKSQDTRSQLTPACRPWAEMGRHIAVLGVLLP